MKRFPFLKWPRRISISNKLYLVVGVLALFITTELLVLWFSVSTLSSVRALVSAEGRWSKAQKDALYNLRSYAQSGKEEEYHKFLYFLEIPLGDKKTRLEMAKENPDMDVMRQGFLKGHNHQDDINGMIKLLQRFYTTHYVQKALSVWAKSDSLVSVVQASADEIHSVISGSGLSSSETITQHLNRINTLNEELNLLGDEFSAILGQGSRGLENLILKVWLFLTFTIEIFGILFTLSISNHISKGLKEIIRAMKQVAKGNFKNKTVYNSKDEIGLVAASFNKMTCDLERYTGGLQYANSTVEKNKAELVLKEKFSEQEQERIDELIETLIKYTMMDFSQKIPVNDEKDDGLNAIAIGLNTLSEELEEHIQQLKEREEQIQTIFKNAPDAVVVMDEEGEIIKWNPVAEIIFGWAANEVIGKNFHEIIVPPRFREVRRDEIDYFLKTKKSSVLNKPIEIPALRKDNSEFDAGISISPTVLKGKYFFICFISDISYRKKNEAKLKESENKFRGLLDSAPDAMVIVTDNGKISMANVQTEKLFDFSRDEIIGKEVELLMPDRFHDVHPPFRRKFFTDPKIRRMGAGLELFGRKKNGVEFPIEIRLSPLRTNEGLLVSAAIRDITERKKTEAEIQKKTKELARSNHELEQFAYVASHDLQEPLRMVSSFLQLLEKHLGEKLDDDSKEYINFAIDGSKRMKNLINSLLEYSRVNTKKPYEWIDLNKIIDAVLQNLNEQIKTNCVIIHQNPLPVIYADAMLMGQLFQNLITNGIKFRGEKNPEIHISVKEEKSHWLFSVKDNGIGIPKEYFDKIFIIFQQLHSQSEFPGTGIGLAICKKIVERHGGKIWVESRLAEGATFYLTIPKKT